MTLGGGTAPPAAFISEAQRLRLPLQIRNHGTGVLDLQLDAHTSLAQAVVNFAEPVLAVPPGDLVSTGVDVLLPPDLHTGRPLVITVRARDADGAWATAQQQWIPECAARPAGAQPAPAPSRRPAGGPERRLDRAGRRCPSR
jgi:hypothetical protein